jgi:phage tail-like protein
LMMAESLWGPIERQITDIHHYFDPMVMPIGLLRWYAHWVDLALDPRWPEEKQRRLLSSIVSLYRRRGTPGGLSEFLELYTGVKPKIDEKRARNFSLGKNALLGPSIAVGRDNVPHSFAVTLRLPRVPDSEAELRRSVIESIIDAEKPAHTSYTLEIFEY